MVRRPFRVAPMDTRSTSAWSALVVNSYRENASPTLLPDGRSLCQRSATSLWSGYIAVGHQCHPRLSQIQLPGAHGFPAPRSSFGCRFLRQGRGGGRDF